MAKRKEEGTQTNPILARQGLTLTIGLTATQADGVTPFDLTGRTGAGQLRKNIRDPNPVATFTVSLTNAVLGQAQAVLGADVIAALDPGDYVADFEFELTAADVEGTDTVYIRIAREVTR